MAYNTSQVLNIAKDTDFQIPRGIAVDSNLNVSSICFIALIEQVYIADTGNGAVKKIAPNAGAYSESDISVLLSGLSYPGKSPL